jgi:hypothetical protein
VGRLKAINEAIRICLITFDIQSKLDYNLEKISTSGKVKVIQTVRVQLDEITKIFICGNCLKLCKQISTSNQYYEMFLYA